MTTTNKEILIDGLGADAVGKNKFMLTQGLNTAMGLTDLVTVSVLPALIQKQDNLEILRDTIGAILAANSANQQALATAKGLEPANYKLRVFVERSNPWEQFTGDPVDISPIVNIWLNNSNYQQSRSNTAKQAVDASFNIDIYGAGQSEGIAGGGQVPGDRMASLEAQRGAKLVRNILMAAQNLYLQMQGVVGKRWIDGIDMFQPQLGNDTVEHVIVARISLSVELNEASPQVSGVPLEQVFVDVKRDGDGILLAETDYDYTTTN